MSRIQHWQEKIKEKKKQTSFRDFLKEITSWKPIILYKNTGYISRYPEVSRIKHLVSSQKYQELRTTLP
ncbi:MAG: hypothetical protein H6767_04995 [Candidatus Peribacteria bacterium]|nr:MAG: hypothetical protein H6767_04995 [Candidatus Peribacteria bacterium]